MDLPKTLAWKLHDVINFRGINLNWIANTSSKHESHWGDANDLFIKLNKLPGDADQQYLDRCHCSYQRLNHGYQTTRNWEPFTSTAQTSAIIYNVHTITLVVMDFILLPLFTTCHIQVSLCLSSKYVQTSPFLSTTFCIAGFVLCISRPSGLSNLVALQVSYSFIIETSVRSFVVNKFPLRIFASTLNLGSVF